MLFEQDEIQGYIAEYLDISPEDSQVVIKSIESQHGLIVERAQRIYSFSHLTFQEYFAAKWFVNSPHWEVLVSHITSKEWREVFFLTVEMLENANSFLKLMKYQVDKLLSNNRILQMFLADIHQKVCDSNAPYKPASVKAFYIGDNQDFSDSIAKLDKNIANDYNYALELCDDIESDLGLNLDEYTTPKEMSIANQIRSSSQFAIAGSIISNMEIRHELYKLRSSQISLTNDDEIFEQDWEDEFGEQDWEENWQAWREKLCDVIDNQNCFHGWEFEDNDYALLHEYYYANKLLVDCLNSGCTVSKVVRQEVEDTLLLPIAEIEEYQSKKCSSEQ
ncbi:MAG: hypothetical protein AAFW70_23335 [Cyanobacteria bacterium J06635_10]